MVKKTCGSAEIFGIVSIPNRAVVFMTYGFDADLRYRFNAEKRGKTERYHYEFCRTVSVRLGVLGSTRTEANTGTIFANLK